MPLTSAHSIKRADQQRRRLNALVFGGNLLLGVVLVGLVLAVLSSSRATHEEQARGAAERVAAIAAANLESEFLVIDTALRLAVDDLQRAGFGAGATSAEINASLAAKQRVLQGVEGLRIADEHGVVRWGNLIDNANPPDIRDRDFFELAKSTTSDRAIVSGPVVSRISRNWVVVVARPMVRGETFEGVLYASINVDRVVKLFRRYELGDNDAVTLRSSDLQLVAWWSPGGLAGGKIGSREVTRQLEDAVHHEPTAGSYIATSGVNRTVAYRQVDGWPFFALVGLDNAKLFGQWRGEMWMFSALAGLVWGLSCAGTFAVYRFGKWEALATAAVAAQSRRTQTLLRVAGDGIHVVDHAGNLIELSDSFAEMHGCSREALLGRHVSTWDVNQNEARIADWLSKIKDGDRQRVEVQHLRADGSVIDVDLHWRAVDIDGHLLVFGAARDVTDRKLLQQSLEQSSERIRDLYDLAPCGYFSIDADGRLVHINAVAEKWLGPMVPSRRLAELLDDANAQLFNDHFLALTSHHRAPNVDICVVREDRHCYLRINSTAVRDEQGHFLMSRTVAVDITEQRDAQLQVEALLRDQSAMLNSDIVGMVKLHGKRISWKNSAFERMLGYDVDELSGLDIDRLFPDRETTRAVTVESQSLMKRGENYRDDVQLKKKSGEKIWVDLNGVQLSETESFWMAVDISKAKKMHEQVTHVAFHDSLTGLPNRLLLLDRMAQALAAAVRFEHKVAVCFIDLDGFKAVNDEHGHDRGDRLLVEIAARLGKVIRATDTAARLGGDEFVVLLAPISEVEWQPIVLRLIQALQAPIELEADLKVTVGVSIGVALSSGKVEAQVLIAEADDAMLQAKRSGKGRFQLSANEL
jgi:diguanylate cyclase (GGDEF)-like protein/PAS domain S-box-containing protein